MSLKEILGEELYNKVTEKLGDQKIDIVNDGRWIPKNKFDEINNEKNNYKSQVDTLNSELNDVKKQIEDNQVATEKIESLQNQIKEKEKEMEKIRKQNAIKLEVLKANPNDVSDILPHLNEESITISDDGKIIGLNEQLENLKETKSYLFKNDEITGTGGSKGNSIRNKDIVFTKEEIANMSPQEINENWDTISKMMESGELK